MTDDATSRMSKFDYSKYDVIVFDEILFANIQMLAKIKRNSEQNPSKIILATGDTNQLETIDLVSNQIDYDVYTDHCVNTIFPTGIMLRENKRLKTQADKDILRRLTTIISTRIFLLRLPSRNISSLFTRSRPHRTSPIKIQLARAL
jgi:hypothetical protein